MEQLALRWEPARKFLTVSQLNARIRDLLDGEFSDVWVSGEISGVRLASSGHYYFTLKDRDSQIKCACFRSSARYLKFKPQDGAAVLARGRIDLYEARGEYQLLVEVLEPQGHGALQFAFEQLKKKLASEGLFEQARKRPLPGLPGRIGIVTSPAGAVIQDMLNILTRRFPGVHIRVFPAIVQGEGSIEAVCRGLRYFSDSGWPQVVIVARGGGSLEDLWTFNEEEVARAIAACAAPVISAVGHETDYTIADFVADLRAPTPSAAAELVIGTREQICELMDNLTHRMEQRMRYRISVSVRALHERGTDRTATVIHRAIGRRFQQVDEMERGVCDQTRRLLRDRRNTWQALEARLRRTDLRIRFAELHRRLQAATHAAGQAVRARTTQARRRLDPLAAQLSQLSPLKVLERGYAIVQDERGRVIKAAAETAVESSLRVRLARGELGVRVETQRPA